MRRWRTDDLVVRLALSREDGTEIAYREQLFDEHWARLIFNVLMRTFLRLSQKRPASPS